MTDKLYQDPEALRELYWEWGMTQAEIAEKLNCSMASVSHYLRQHNIKSPRVGNQWHDKEKLKEMYWDKGMTQQEIADEFGCSRKAIRTAFGCYDIETRDKKEVHRNAGRMGVSHYFNQGYSFVSVSGVDGGYIFPVHRIMALVDHSLEEIDGKHVHHKNNMRCDNRFENLELIDPSEHGSIHSSEEKFWEKDGEKA
jgi:DNA-binding XRE family transcriptional regulator